MSSVRSAFGLVLHLVSSVVVVLGRLPLMICLESAFLLGARLVLRLDGGVSLHLLLYDDVLRLSFEFLFVEGYLPMCEVFVLMRVFPFMNFVSTVVSVSVYVLTSMACICFS